MPVICVSSKDIGNIVSLTPVSAKDIIIIITGTGTHRSYWLITTKHSTSIRSVFWRVPNRWNIRIDTPKRVVPAVEAMIFPNRSIRSMPHRKKTLTADMKRRVFRILGAFSMITRTNTCSRPTCVPTLRRVSRKIIAGDSSRLSRPDGDSRKKHLSKIASTGSAILSCVWGGGEPVMKS